MLFRGIAYLQVFERNDMIELGNCTKSVFFFFFSHLLALQEYSTGPGTRSIREYGCLGHVMSFFCPRSVLHGISAFSRSHTVGHTLTI
jgi:hypothetical protein